VDLYEALTVRRLALVRVEARLASAPIPRLLGAGSWAGPAHDLYERRLDELRATAALAAGAVAAAREQTERAMSLAGASGVR